MAERLKDMKRRLRKLEEVVSKLVDRSIIVKIESEQELETLVMIAAQHGMRLSEYARSCVIKYSNDFLEANKPVESGNDLIDEDEVAADVEEEPGKEEEPEVNIHSGEGD